ncbi:MAG: glycoside hydrolase [Chloroflexi bacterium]|nr:glycoside hydrolase [Chloroflexota bacterium]
MKLHNLVAGVILLSFIVACAPASPSVDATEVSPAPEGEPIYLAIIWHQHQPVYYKDPETGLYVRPWVRVHAAKDYLDMAAMLEEYPQIHATFNITPSLIRQLDDFEAGAKDLYWAMAEVPADELTSEEKQFILDRFFDTNREIISRFPRYQELLALRDGNNDPVSAYSVQDFRDLQVLFNLAWTDPDWLAQEPLASLVAKGEGFNEGDKGIVFAEHLRIISEVIPLHRRLQKAGLIEVTMTPFAHPILPLLVTTQLAREALPELELPGEPFVYGQDATAQVELGLQFYEDHFGVPPRGMWPAEGSVAQEIVTMVSQAGLQWIASDEGVLAKSLGLESFERNSQDVVVNADSLYRPYYVQGRRGQPVAILFRDVVISDKVGFTYSGMDGELAATDFITRIHNIREELIDSGAEGPHLVTVLLDGENAWEYYENDGKEFLNSLYAQLSEDPLIKTVTPSEFLALAPEQPFIEDLWAGSWINHDFSTWIGEEEENAAWELLAQTRTLLQTYITGENKDAVTSAQLDAALEQMYIAEGSDWFWWYGGDQNSGNDDIFDEQYRSTLKLVYEALGEQPPSILDVPIIPQAPATADQSSQGLFTPRIDGVIGQEEWAAGGRYQAASGVMANSGAVFESLLYGFDSSNLYIGLNLTPPFEDDSKIDIYLSVPGGDSAISFSTAGSVLGFLGELRLEVNPISGSAQLFTASANGEWLDTGSSLRVGISAESIEVAIPRSSIGNADTGDTITLRAYYQLPNGLNGEFALSDVDQLPSQGPARLTVPDLGTTEVLLEVSDPEGDDYGPGTYTYPQDVVFNAGNFDILNFQVGEDGENVVFKFVVRGPVDNPWGSPNGLALQTFDIYIDTDHDGVGGKALFPGRNLALEGPFAWDFGIHAEGWTAGIYVPSEEDGISQVASSSDFQILADSGQRKITIRVPKSILGDNPEDWAFTAMVLSQEGFPSGGVMRVRDVLPIAEQWRIGGGPVGATNHTRVMDLVWPAPGFQEEWLSSFAPSSLPQTELTASDFARIPMLEISQ